jgi:hypothetical protein
VTANASCAHSSASASATAWPNAPRAASANSRTTSRTSTTESPLDAEIADVLAEHDNPLDDLLGAGTNLAATTIAQAGDVRRFPDAGAFARFCGAAPIPGGSGQTTGRHRLHRGGNRQLNAALHRIAIVQQRNHPAAKTYLAPKIAEGNPPARPAAPSSATSHPHAAVGLGLRRDLRLKARTRRSSSRLANERRSQAGCSAR